MYKVSFSLRKLNINYTVYMYEIKNSRFDVEMKLVIDWLGLYVSGKLISE